MNLLLSIIGLTLLLGTVLALIIRQHTYNKRVADAEEYGRPTPTEPKTKHRDIALMVVGVALITLSKCFTIIPTGYTGVRTTFGLIDQESCKPGLNLVAPYVQRISLVNNKQQDLRFTGKVWSETKEQTVVFMENVVVTYQIVPESSAWIYANVENWVEELVDADIVSSSLKAASRELGADVVTNRSLIESAGKQELQDSIDQKYGPNRVLIKNIIINNMDFEDSYNQAIARKSEAIQQQQEQAIRNETNIKKATADAEAARVAAQGKADAALIEAEGKAKANEIISNSITDATQRQDTINKWNGELPKYMGNDDNMFGIFESAVTGSGN